MGRLSKERCMKSYPTLTVAVSCLAVLRWRERGPSGPRIPLRADPGRKSGPYYVDDKTLRQDVTEGRPGLPLRLRVALVDSRTCAAVERRGGYLALRCAGCVLRVHRPGWRRGRRP